MLPTIRRVKLVDEREFAAAALDPEHETYVVHIASLSSASLVASLNSAPLVPSLSSALLVASLSSAPLIASFDVYPSRRPQISGLIAKKASTKVLVEYSDFVDIFSPDLAIKLPEYTKISTHVIDLEEDKQPPYGPIYSLGPMELETLKTYIKTNLANGFICLLKSLVGTLILFNKKSNGSFYLYVDYQGLNNITIKNWYPLLLVGKFLDRLGRAKQFT